MKILKKRKFKIRCRFCGKKVSYTSNNTRISGSLETGNDLTCSVEVDGFVYTKDMHYVIVNCSYCGRKIVLKEI